MLNLNKTKWFQSLADYIQSQGYYAIVNTKNFYQDSYIALTISDKSDYLLLLLDRKSILFNQYELKLLTTNFSLLKILNDANSYHSESTFFTNSLKAQFHNRLGYLIQFNASSQNDILKYFTSNEEFQFTISETFKGNELNNNYNNFKAAYGFSESNILVYGIALYHENLLGGLMICNPFELIVYKYTFIGWGKYGETKNRNLIEEDSFDNKIDDMIDDGIEIASDIVSDIELDFDFDID